MKSDAELLGAELGRIDARIDKRRDEITALTNRLAEVELLLSLWAMAHQADLSRWSERRMTTPTKDAPADGVALAQTTSDGPAQLPMVREYKSVLSASTQELLAERKAVAAVAAKIAEQNWGKALDMATRQAVAAYLRGHALDVTEIFVLGGNIYRNGQYFLRRLSEMIEEGLVESAGADHINVDKRLDAMAQGTGDEAKWARDESNRRTQERILHNAPDAAVACVVFRVKLASVPEEFTGCKWTGGGTRKNDPVGDAVPVETAETRAARRCLRQVASQMPALKRIEDILDEGAEVVSTQIVEAHERAKIARENISTLDHRLMPVPDDPYDVTPKPTQAPALDMARNEKLARHDALLGKRKRTDDEDLELDDLRIELFDREAATDEAAGRDE